MPKIIPDLRNRILMSARTQMMERGFSGLSLRNVAKDCRIAIGTTYNYFSSKADLAVCVMQEDWDRIMEKARINALGSTTSRAAINAIYLAISEFVSNYHMLMSQEEARAHYSELINRNHDRLINDISSVLGSALTESGFTEPASRLRLLSVMILAAATEENRNDEDFAVLVDRAVYGLEKQYA